MKELGGRCKSERDGEREDKVAAMQRVQRKEKKRIPDFAALIRPNWSRSINPCLALQSPAVICLIADTFSSICPNIGYVFPQACRLCLMSEGSVKNKGLRIYNTVKHHLIITTSLMVLNVKLKNETIKYKLLNNYYFPKDTIFSLPIDFPPFTQPLLATNFNTI